MQPILETNKLSISFTQYSNGLQQQQLINLKEISLKVNPGEILAIIGASGSGKSLFAHSIFGLLPGNAQVSGDIFFKGNRLNQKRIEAIRGKEIALIPQTLQVLDPLIKVGKQVELSVKRGDPKEKRQQAFEYFQLEPEVANMYPHEISGGMARKILVSIAFLTNAELIIADEPTPGMDPDAINDTLKQIAKLQNENTSLILIMHDIETAIKIVDRITIFLEGKIIETAHVDQFQGDGELLTTSYAKNLWRSLPINGFHLPK